MKYQQATRSKTSARASLIAGGFLMVMALMILPLVASANNTGVFSDVFDPVILQGPLVVCSGSPGGGKIGSVCNNICDLVDQIANVVYFFIAVVIWIIAPILVAVGGLMIMFYGASPEMVSRGKKTITGAIWSIVIVLCAWLIVYTVVTFFNIQGVGGFNATLCTLPSNSTTNTTNGNPQGANGGG
jgi:hypothetical protein